MTLPKKRTEDRCLYIATVSKRRQRTRLQVLRTH